MIYISQGHEQSIALEILIKSVVLLKREEREQLTLVCYQKSLENTLQALKIRYSIKKKDGLLTFSGTSLQCYFLQQTPTTESNECLLTCLELIQKSQDSSTLITQPTSKNQLFLNSHPQSGHTELFRSYFAIHELPMVFSYQNFKVLLITDHIPLYKVSTTITEDLIIKKVSITLNDLKKYFYTIEEIIFSGINPHAGEGGILGTEEDIIKKSITALQQKFPHQIFKGPFSGDTLLSQRKEKKAQLFIYMYHDQGLAPFKALNGPLGINITLGLPFLRLSVDHGTAFDLYGKDKANFLGCYYTLKTALSVHQSSVHSENKENNKDEQKRNKSIKGKSP